MRLRIAAKVDQADRNYFEQVIRPQLEFPLIEFVGEIGEDAKCAFLGNAQALLFPIDWPEPFGLVMIEAMSAGTPVIAFRSGSVPEIVTHGVTGYIVQSVDEAASAARQVRALKRTGVREHFERRFTASRMAEDYMKAYEALAKRETIPRSSLAAA